MTRIEIKKIILALGWYPNEVSYVEEEYENMSKQIKSDYELVNRLDEFLKQKDILFNGMTDDDLKRELQKIRDGK